MADQSIIRISKELKDLQTHSDLSLAVACRDEDLRSVKALIMGPHESPYEFGFFEFSMRFGREYPRKAPSVTALTTNGGRTRFNPNIYSSGKVCLSILGTWRGQSGEEWSAAQGLESILLSIQSLMSSNPYENEPGFETANDALDKKNQKEYVRKIRHETIRISVIQRLEEYLHLCDSAPAVDPSYDANDSEEAEDASLVFEPFKDICKRRFLWYFDSYLASVRKAKSETADGSIFQRMPFEGSNNIMEGKFHFSELERRLIKIKQALDIETQKWAEEGAIALAAETTVAVNLQHQFGQVTQSFVERGIAHDLQLADGNPFVWVLTYFGQPMTNLDGGLFRIKFHFSPRFPDEQPRVKFETPIFHHRVAPDMTVCYFPNPVRKEDVGNHIDSVLAVLEESEPAYDPRTIVNPEAHGLFWGGSENRRVYNRRLRRSVQQSIEEM
jgi:ubiquitin-conjugating enzyme E2 Z